MTLLSIQNLLREQGFLGEILEVAQNPFGPVYEVWFEPRHILPSWKVFRQAVENTGYWPIVSQVYYPEFNYRIGLDRDNECLSEVKAFSVALNSMLTIQTQTDFFDYEPLSLLYKRLQSETIDKLPEYIEDRDELLAQFPHDWRSFTPSAPVIQPLDNVLGTAFTFYPLTQGWQVPLLIHYGNFMNCPDDVTNAALFKYWQNQYDAELVVTGYGWLGFTVGKPPSNPAQALLLSWEHMAYCPFHIPLGMYAANLMQSDTWAFSWSY